MKQFTSLKFQEESKFTLTCSLNKGSSPVEFSWLKDGLPLTQSYIKIKTDQDILISTLIIEKLKSSDAGNYTCQAQNSAGRDSHVLKLIVKQTPKWLKEPMDLITAIGRDVSVECSASGSPTPLITWFKLDQPKRKLLDTNSLRLYQITREAAGLYECVADNGVDEVLRKTISVLVNVAEAPEIIKQSSGSYKLKEDDKFSLVCSLSKGTNPILFTWLKDNKPITEGHVKILNLEALAATSLVIERLKSSDAGNYTCQAKNSAGQDSHTLQLTIKQTPKWLIEPQDVIASVGSEITAECSAIGSPIPVITWFRLTQPNQRIRKGNYLRLTDVSNSDADLYECVADNGVDEVLRKTIKVSVNAHEIRASSFRHQRAAIEAPEIVKQSGNLVKLQEGAKFSATCSLSKGTSPVKFTWLKNGSPVAGQDAKIRNIDDLSMTTLTIDVLKSSAAGNYTCKAENAAGHDSHTIQLSIKQTPKWLKEPEDVVAVLGEDYSVECAATGSPNPTITWFRLNQPSRQKLFNGNYLKLNDISSGASGLYECVADNGVDDVLRKTIKVLVNELEYWYLAPFECLGSLNEMWRWFIPVRFWELKVKMAMRLCVTVLIVLNVMSLNGLEYGLRKQFSVKARRASDEIPEIIKQLKDLELKENMKFTVLCTLQKGSTPVEFTWLKDGKSLAVDYAKITKLQDLSVITIDKLTASDAGSYTCEAKNNAGQDSMTLALKVKHTPKWTKEPGDMIAAIGEDITAECSASGSPTPAISWFKLNDHIRQSIAHGEQLRLQPVKQEDVGNYECVADNGVDEPLKQTFKLSVNGW
ncbi:Hemicentin-1 [Halotydeus destructor]|nr:Hemicentin-1 [Halotydeus destructor]